MKIVIAGAGDMGYHLAQQLAAEDANDITIIDENKDTLDYVGTHLDILTVLGDATSIAILRRAAVQEADLFMAVTTSEKTNMLSTMLAKQLGAKNVISRVRIHDYLEEKNQGIFANLGVDKLISPTMLCSEEIVRMIENATFTEVFEFEEGKFNIVGITLDQYSKLVNRRIADMGNEPIFKDIRIIAIVRDQRTIIPRGSTYIRNNDHIFFISSKQANASILELLGQKKVDISNIMIIGGDDMAYTTALKLEKEYNVTLVHKEKERCKWLAEQLNDTLVIHGDYRNIELLLEEGLEQMQAFIALTESSETNIITSLSAKNHKVYKAIAHVDTREYIHISHSIGVDSLINKKLVAANQITRFLRKGSVEAVSGIYGVDAEFVQYSISKGGRMTRKPLKALNFPDSAIIAGIIRGEQVFIPDGEFRCEAEDKVIVFALPAAKSALEKIFN
ncbi:potassium transporter peripheral membrane component [Nitritalea halalkaliphila LW7]|uniref:Trk system potassium uptake protein TrkA n=1 Tax=Nitritalea halalkaliphila LW7 TaxID=1189621 RepID=I5C6U6_9BACT|nr:Trk system potassium transporter TrkA [Nitritalea halalkaliphila]EIM77548.1 potassium transporter peripheral membrane component [Nitritalea halalkaliphila LW7]